MNMTSNNNNNNNNNDNNTGYHRPRRPTSETISYLRGLPLNVELAQQEIDDFINNTNTNTNTPEPESESELDFPQQLTAALISLDEIKSEIASLAGDEDGSQSLEKIVRICVPYSELATRILLRSCQGYYLHLATHRYGSHFLQTLLELCNTSLTTRHVDFAKHNDGPGLQVETDLPSLYDLLQQLVDELSSSLNVLTQHICGSHIVRTLLCVFGGVKPLNQQKHGGSEIRGKPKSSSSKKKKKKKKSTEEDSSARTMMTLTLVYQPKHTFRILPADSDKMLQTLMSSLIHEQQESPEVSLQQLSYDIYGGPLLVVLIKVLTYRDYYDYDHNQSTNKNVVFDGQDGDYRLAIQPTEPTYRTGSHILADRLVKRILRWQQQGEQLTTTICT